MKIGTYMGAWVVVCVATPCVLAQTPRTDPPPMPPAAATQQDPKPPTADGERSLDELLGIGEGDGAKSAQESARDRSSNLKRVLTEQEAKNTLEAAIEGMRRSGVLLGERDFGTAVQRVQEDVLARLDALINTAEQQQQQQQQQQSSSSSSSRSSSSSSDQQQQQGGKDQRPGETAEQAAERRRREEAQRRAGREAQQGNQQRQQSGDGNTPGELPEQVDPIEGGALSETDSEWGNLPPRTRDMVQQGVREKMSSVYRRWTEAYYRRIAEEAKR